MSQSVMLVPVGSGVGLTSVSMGVVRACEQLQYAVAFFKPVAQQAGEQAEALVQVDSQVHSLPSFEQAEVQTQISNQNMDRLIERVLERCEEARQSADFLILEGLINSSTISFGERLNLAVAKALDAQIILVASAQGQDLEAMSERIEIAAETYGGSDLLAGCIVNRVGETDSEGAQRIAHSVSAEKLNAYCQEVKSLPLFKELPLLGAIPWNRELMAPRVKDLADYLKAEYLSEGDAQNRRIRRMALCSRTVTHLLEHLQASTLLVTAGDRQDIVVAASLAVMNGTQIGGLILTGGFELDDTIHTLCAPAFKAGLPVLRVQMDSWECARRLNRYEYALAPDDSQRIQKVKESVAQELDTEWFTSLNNSAPKTQLSPAAFRFRLMQKAAQAQAKIVLPEGHEARTIKAASICAERGLAHCVLLGQAESIQEIAQQHGVKTDFEGFEILDPEEIRDSLVEPLVELRQHKGLTALSARDHLQDAVVVGTMMLQQGQVDGLVSGAVHTTAHTIRPALQLIKTAPDSELVSSVFFMLLPDKVLVYGDCAINTNPDAKQLAEIAVQSARSAHDFGLEPRVAMISYSTGSSGQGADVEKVREATERAQQEIQKLDFEVLLDGPLQYDAAIMPDVAQSKAPDSPVAGRANVFIFPDLNTGNTTYKAVQRSAKALSIGPMLQGLKRPVNDLSRGALVDDIVYTIALTAVQTAQRRIQ